MRATQRKEIKEQASKIADLHEELAKLRENETNLQQQVKAAERDIRQLQITLANTQLEVSNLTEAYSDAQKRLDTIDMAKVMSHRRLEKIPAPERSELSALADRRNEEAHWISWSAILQVIDRFRPMNSHQYGWATWARGYVKKRVEYITGSSIASDADLPLAAEDPRCVGRELGDNYAETNFGVRWSLP